MGAMAKGEAVPVQRGQARLSSRQWHPQETCQIVQFLRRTSELVLSMKSLDFFQYWLFPLLNTGQAKRNVFGPCCLWGISGPTDLKGQTSEPLLKSSPFDRFLNAPSSAAATNRKVGHAAQDSTD